MPSDFRNYRRIHPRLDRRFEITLSFDSMTVEGLTTNVSSFGATIEVSEVCFEILKSNFREPFVVLVKTSLNDLSGQINAMFESSGKYFVGLKLLDDRSWYS